LKVRVSKTYRVPIHLLNVAGHTVNLAGELLPLLRSRQNLNCRGNK